MQVITTTELRTKSSKLISTLEKGGSVRLIHRSKIVGEIIPTCEPKPLDKEGIKSIKKTALKLNLPKLSYKQREVQYRKHLYEIYGKDIS